MTGLAAGIGLAGALAGTAASMKASGDANARAGESIAAARENMQMQGAIQKEMLRQQREMQIAPQRDADGNMLVYSPENGWIPLLSDRGRLQQQAGYKARDIETEKYFGRGQYEDKQAFQRRFQEGDQARQLMDAIRNNVGAPTREGVVGRNKIAAATSGAEPASIIQSGGALASLRGAGDSTALQRQYQKMDPNVLQGVRAKLAAADAGGDEAYTDARSRWMDMNIGPYKAFAGGAAPPGQNTPTTGTDILSAGAAARAAKPMQQNPYAGYGSNVATGELIKAMGQRSDFDYGKAITGFTDKYGKQIAGWIGGSKTEDPNAPGSMYP